MSTSKRGREVVTSKRGREVVTSKRGREIVTKSLHFFQPWHYQFR